MDVPSFKRTRISETDRARLLDRLDYAESRQAKNPRRMAPRVEYRVRDIPLSVNHPGGGVGRYIVLGRNLSSGGISLLHAGYLHTGTECRLALTLPRGGAKTLIGKVVFCRLVAGPIHEVGVQFNQKIDLAEFASPEVKQLCDDCGTREAMQPLSGNALLVAASEAERRLIEARLKQSGLNPTVVDRAGAAVDQVKLLSYSLAVIDMNLPDPGPTALVRALLNSGFAGCVVGLASDDSQGEAARAAAMGMHGCIMKPVRHEAMHTLLSKLMRDSNAKVDDGAPITSSLAGEHGSEELIQFFISAAREAAAAITGAIQKNDPKTVKKECQTLKSIAGGYGFQSVAEAAKHVITAFDLSPSLTEAMGRITVLLNLLSRLSLGKRFATTLPDGEAPDEAAKSAA